jgi:hypothetical protein
LPRAVALDDGVALLIAREETLTAEEFAPLRPAPVQGMEPLSQL